MSAANRACFEDWQQQLAQDPEYLEWVKLYDTETRKLADKGKDNGNNSESQKR